MNLTTWDPFGELETIFDRRNKTAASWAPAVNISESDDKFTIDIELAGVDKNDVDIEVKDGILSIKGEKKMKKEEKDKDNKYHRVEISYGEFVRSFTLPKDVDSDRISASYNDGVLKLDVPKGEEQKPKQISIK